MSRPVKPQRHSRVRMYALVFALLATLVVVVSLTLVPTRSATQPSPAPHFVDVSPSSPQAAAPRSVVVVQRDETMPHMSGVDEYLMTSLLDGTIPADQSSATVLTDENCAPDPQGISHCRNTLDFGGQQLTVQHHHKMSTTPCLTPGEKVQVLTLTQYQQVKG